MSKVKIDSKEYEKLIDDSYLKLSLEKEVSRLSKLISSETKDCNVGEWCMDCIHHGEDGVMSTTETVIYGRWFSKIIEDGKVIYCKKHLHEVCPEFEIK